MRNFSKLSIVLTHEEKENSAFSAPLVEVRSGNNVIQVSNFETALKMVPQGSTVYVFVSGSLSNATMHNLSRVIRESGALVSLDLSSVTDLSRVFDSPFKENHNLLSISFPCNMLSLNPQALAGCKNLESVTIPATVQKIGEQAFAGCEKLSYLRFDSPENWFITPEQDKKLEVRGLDKSDDNPFRFSLPSSPLRNCTLNKALDA